MKVVLCIGGLDPAGRAGLLADARAVEALGARAICVATALTHQSSIRVEGLTPVPPEVLAAQLAPLLRDEPIRAIKVGMLGTPANAAIIAALLPGLPMVLDTPLVSSSGAWLLESDDVPGTYAPLLARATLVTPNAPEALLLAGLPPGDERGVVEEAARRLGRAVLLKGGHLPGARVIDVLLAAEERREFSAPRIEGRFRGTGCRLASAIAARLAEGDPLEAAIEAARHWLLSRIYLESRGKR